MPLPNPHKKEERDEFVSRCMGDEAMNKEFKNDKQRVAVCYSLYKKAKQAKGEDGVNWDDSKGDNPLIY